MWVSKVLLVSNLVVSTAEQQGYSLKHMPVRLYSPVNILVEHIHSDAAFISLYPKNRGGLITDKEAVALKSKLELFPKQ